MKFHCGWKKKIDQLKNKFTGGKHVSKIQFLCKLNIHNTSKHTTLCSLQYLYATYVRVRLAAAALGTGWGVAGRLGDGGWVTGA